MAQEVGYFDVRLKPDVRRNAVWQEISVYLHEYFKKSGTVLELGAGYCDFINSVPGAKKFAMDLSEIVKDFAGQDVESIIGSATDLSLFPDNSVDVVIASNLCEHLSNDDFNSLLKEVSRVLVVGGRFILMQPNFYYAYREYFDDYTHKKIFTHTGLCGQLQVSGFNIDKCISRFVPFSMASVRLPTPRFIIWCYLRSPWKPFAKQMLVIAEKK
jgi:SAM-dependent methyltransferase